MSTVNLSKIKEIAEAKRVPMAQVAEAAGITPTGLSHLIRVNSTRVDTLEKIADFLGVAITDFFTDAPTPSPWRTSPRRGSLCSTSAWPTPRPAVTRETYTSEI